ncbi:hypothetical protein [Microbacterium sp. A94]|uniref:hypothetical protein n=1 Tax=Microbacterium sp. A94 TaxID=3450717 RepID=UPI003F435E7C
MIQLRRKHDTVRTTAAVPAVVVWVLFLVFVSGTALLLVPVVGWQIIVVLATAVGIVFPQSFGGWIAIAGIAIGMLMSEPMLWQTAVAVFAVHVIHVLSSLLLVLRWNSRVVLVALRPTLRRLLLIQLIAQPVTLLVMLVFTGTAVTVSGATIIGAGALAILVIVLILALGHSRRRS